MKKWLTRKHVQYALVSISCPLLTIMGVFFYQKIAYRDFWQSIEQHPDPDNAHVVALMVIGLIELLFVATGLACLVGSLMAVISVKKQKRLIGIGTFALLINGLPLALILLFFGRAWLRGGY